MDFIKKMVTKAVVKTVETVAINSVGSHMEKTRSVDALVNKSTANYMLFIKEEDLFFKHGFTVRDESDDEKYVVKTDRFTFGHPCIRLYDMAMNELGRIKLSSKNGMGTYAMFLEGKEIATITLKMSVKIRFDLDFNGWHLDGSLMQDSFVVTDRNGDQVLKFNQAFSSCETYVLEMNNREYEILGLLLVMVVELNLHGND